MNTVNVLEQSEADQDTVGSCPWGKNQLELFFLTLKILKKKKKKF